MLKMEEKLQERNFSMSLHYQVLMQWSNIEISSNEQFSTIGKFLATTSKKIEPTIIETNEFEYRTR